MRATRHSFSSGRAVGHLVEVGGKLEASPAQRWPPGRCVLSRRHAARGNGLSRSQSPSLTVATDLPTIPTPTSEAVSGAGFHGLEHQPEPEGANCLGRARPGRRRCRPLGRSSPRGRSRRERGNSRTPSISPRRRMPRPSRRSSSGTLLRSLHMPATVRCRPIADPRRRGATGGSRGLAELQAVVVLPSGGGRGAGRRRW